MSELDFDDCCPTCGESPPDAPIPGTAITVGYVNDLAEGLHEADRIAPRPPFAARWGVLNTLTGVAWSAEYDHHPLPRPTSRTCCPWLAGKASPGGSP